MWLSALVALSACVSVFGDTCMPWFWSGYVPYDRPELREPEAREHPPPPCGLRPRGG